MIASDEMRNNDGAPLQKSEHKANIYLALVGCCCIEIMGKDGKKHILTTDATSTYDAVSKAIQAWSKLWWWDSHTVAIVKRNDESWNVPVRKVIERQSRSAVTNRFC